MIFGIIGTNHTGKTTLASLLGGIDYEMLFQEQMASRERTIVVKVPDPRLESLARVEGTNKKIVFACLEIKDTKPLGLSPETRLKNNEILARLKEVDGLILVIGAFQDKVSPETVLKEIDDIKTELLMNDLAILEKRIGKLNQELNKPLPAKEIEQNKKELFLLEKLRNNLNTGEIKQIAGLDQESQKLIKGFGFLTQKPLVFLLNIAETDLNTDKFKIILNQYSPCYVACLKLEKDLNLLSDAEKQEFMKEYGLEKLVTPELIKACYQAAQLISFFTIGKDEIKAWTIQQGDNALTAAGKIHSDMARGFIAAEVVNFQEWQLAGSMKSVREQGKLRLEGKSYIVKDGDIIHFRFNI